MTYAVKIEALAATLGTSIHLIQRRVACGTIPKPDAVIGRKHPTGWYVETVAQWNPQVGNRLKRAIEADVITSYIPR